MLYTVNHSELIGLLACALRADRENSTEHKRNVILYLLSATNRVYNDECEIEISADFTETIRYGYAESVEDCYSNKFMSECISCSCLDGIDCLNRLSI